MKSSDEDPGPKKFLFISREGVAVDLAYKVQKEGNKVKVHISTSSEKEVGDGFVPKVRQWEKHVDWADVIVFDSWGQGELAQELRKKGKLVIGGTPYTDRLETDRSFGQEELKRHGVKILNYKEFTSFEEGVRYVQENPGCYVIKPSGEVQEQKQLLFVGDDKEGADVIRILTAYEKAWGDDIEVFQLQKRVTGVEIGVTALFNGKKFIKPFNINFEHKKLFPGELGVSTGEMGTSMFWVDENEIFDATLKKMEHTLAQEGYCGWIDINCIVNGNGIYPLEFTTRFGHPTICIQEAAFMEPVGGVLYRLASGEDFEVRTRSDFQVGVLVVVPPFPFKDKRTFDAFSKDAIIVFKNKSQLEGLHIQDNKLINGEWLITGSTGIALLVTGCGQTMKKAQQQAYSRIHNVLISNMYYRTDIGDRWVQDSDRLHSWGYL